MGGQSQQRKALTMAFGQHLGAVPRSYGRARHRERPETPSGWTGALAPGRGVLAPIMRDCDSPLLFGRRGRLTGLGGLQSQWNLRRPSSDLPVRLLSARRQSQDSPQWPEPDSPLRPSIRRVPGRTFRSRRPPAEALPPRANLALVAQHLSFLYHSPSCPNPPPFLCPFPSSTSIYPSAFIFCHFAGPFFSLHFSRRLFVLLCPFGASAATAPRGLVGPTSATIKKSIYLDPSGQVACRTIVFGGWQRCSPTFRLLALVSCLWLQSKSRSQRAFGCLGYLHSLQTNNLVDAFFVASHRPHLPLLISYNCS